MVSNDQFRFAIVRMGRIQTPLNVLFFYRREDVEDRICCISVAFRNNRMGDFDRYYFRVNFPPKGVDDVFT